MFWESQPTVLNASATPTDTPFEVVLLSSVASIVDVFCASTITSPGVSPAVVVTSLSTILAVAPLSTRFVATADVDRVRAAAGDHAAALGGRPSLERREDRGGLE